MPRARHSRPARNRSATRSTPGADAGAAGLTHLDAAARPTMVGVAAKGVTHRIAEAQARVWLPAAVAHALAASGHRTHKGPVFDTAILAGVMGAKRTAELIPFCHPLPLENCQVWVELERGAARARRPSPAWVLIRCRVEVHHKTGVEMEALTGACIAALTIYDMCKALSHRIRIGPVRLLLKSGGRRQVGSADGRSRAARDPNRARRPRSRE